MINFLRPTTLIDSIYQSLGMHRPEGSEIDEVFLGAFTRRIAGISCPCSRIALLRRVSESLSFADFSEIAERIDLAIEGLLWTGDLIELSDVAITEGGVQGTWLFASPPSFVSLSTTDRIGHDYGPDSKEIHDHLLRLDRWFGWFHIWMVIVYLPGSFVPLFKSVDW